MCPFTAKVAVRLEQEALIYFTTAIGNNNCTIYYASTAERAYFSTTATSWILDSGATRHFTDVKSDFQTLKRWSTPKNVQTADQITTQALGYGTVVVGSLTEVQYVPDFSSVRMLSVKALNDSGIRAGKWLCWHFSTRPGPPSLQLHFECQNQFHTDLNQIIFGNVVHNISPFGSCCLLFLAPLLVSGKEGSYAGYSALYIHLRS